MNMRLAITILLCTLMSGCGLRPTVGKYTTKTAEQAVRAWTDAYNSGQYRQLVLLMHPSMRDRFEDRASEIRKQLKTWRINRFELRDEVMVRRNLMGRKVMLEYNDGRRPNVHEGIVVKTRDRWWVWSY